MPIPSIYIISYQKNRVQIRGRFNMNKNTIIGIVLMIAVFVGFSFYQSHEMKEQQQILDEKAKKEQVISAQKAAEREAQELAEAAAMEVYLPKQLSEAEVEEQLKAIIAETGASKPSDMGKVMGVATKRLAGLAEGRLISTLVKKLLS